MRFNRVWHPVALWEEMATPMWESIGGCTLQDCVDFTGNHVLYGQWMRKVIEQWPISCENALTNYNINRKAWVGHAAAAMAIGSPESLTRKAWGYLDDRQRTLANREAARCIGLWEADYIKGSGLRGDMAQSLLL